MNPPRAPRRTGRVTIVIPAKDEEAAIGATLDAIPMSTLAAAGYEVDLVVLDGRSDDRTAHIARQRGATVIEDNESGKGCALRQAIPYLDGDFVVMLDGDGTYAPDAIPRMLEPLSRSQAEIVMGRRQVRPGAMNAVHKLGNVLLSCGASILYGRACRDLCTGMWAFRTDALRALPLRCRGFELEAEMFALASRLDLTIGQVPVDYLPRKGATKLDTGDGIRIGWCLLSCRFRSVGATADPQHAILSTTVKAGGR